MKALVLLLLFTFSLCSVKTQFTPVTKEYCDRCIKRGYCPIACEKYFRKLSEVKPKVSGKYCDQCEKGGLCPLICKEYFIKKFEKQCDKCEKGGYCPLICKNYFIKKNENK